MKIRSGSEVIVSLRSDGTIFSKFDSAYIWDAASKYKQALHDKYGNRCLWRCSRMELNSLSLLQDAAEQKELMEKANAEEFI